MTLSERIVSKLETDWDHPNSSIKREKYPRLPEILWFAEAMSREPGGIGEIDKDVRKEFGSCVKLDEREERSRRLLGIPVEERTFFSYFLDSSLRYDLGSELDCGNLYVTLCDYMDLWRSRVVGSVAPTETQRIVFRELNFARAMKVPVPFVGDSRIGKTKVSEVWAKSQPGLARVVTVPESNTERDFHRAHADALGINYQITTPGHLIKERVERVLRHGGLFLIFDEAHFLVPQNVDRQSPPHRLNWVRCQVIDKGIGCAFFMTPQNRLKGDRTKPDRTISRYAEKTGYVLEQWVGRCRPPVVLPGELAKDDLMAVARLNFPGITVPLLKLIVARAMQSEGYLQSIDVTAKRALFVAGESGRALPTKEDVMEAIADMMPGIRATPRISAPLRDTVAERSLNVRDTPAPSMPVVRGMVPEEVDLPDLATA